MLAYYTRLALIGMRSAPALSALTVGAIALGIGVVLTVLSVYTLMSADPIPHKSDVLHAVTLDGWDPASPYRERQPDLPPWELTYMDAMVLRGSDIPTYAAAMYKGGFSVQPENPAVRPFSVVARMTDRDLFSLFELSFIHGAPWSESADNNGEFVVVLTRTINDKLFGGENSVGRRLRLGDNEFTITGIVEDWHPTPKYYDVNNGAFDDGEEIFAPFALTEQLELYSDGNTNCWKDEEIDNHAAFLGSECVWVQYWVQLDSGQQRDAYQRYLDEYVRGQQSLGRFARPLNNRVFPLMEWLQARQVVKSDARVMLTVAFMFLAVTVFNTVGLLLAKFIARAPHVGVRRALGASRRSVFSQQLVEAGIVGLAAGVLGMGLAWLGLRGVRSLYNGFDRLTHMEPEMIVVGFAIALVSACAAGIYPAWRVCRTPPSIYLRIQ